MSAFGENKPTEKPAEGKASDIVCGVPLKDLRDLYDAIPGTLRRQMGEVIKRLRAFQREIDAFSEDDGLTAAFLAIDAEESDPIAAHRKKTKRAIATIDPRKLKLALELALLDGNMLAAKQISDILALPIEAKSKAADDRPPGITFEYGEMTEEEARELSGQIGRGDGA